MNARLGLHQASLSQENLLFGNLKHLIDGSITKAKPDSYDGSRPADLNKQIREELGSKFRHILVTRRAALF